MIGAEIVACDPHRARHATVIFRGLEARPTSAGFAVLREGGENPYLGPKGWTSQPADCATLQRGWDAENKVLWAVVGPEVVDRLDEGPYSLKLRDGRVADGIYPADNLTMPDAKKGPAFRVDPDDDVCRDAQMPIGEALTRGAPARAPKIEPVKPEPVRAPPPLPPPLPPEQAPVAQSAAPIVPSPPPPVPKAALEDVVARNLDPLEPHAKSGHGVPLVWKLMTAAALLVAAAALLYAALKPGSTSPVASIADKSNGSAPVGERPNGGENNLPGPNVDGRPPPPPRVALKSAPLDCAVFGDVRSQNELPVGISPPETVSCFWTPWIAAGRLNTVVTGFYDRRRNAALLGYPPAVFEVAKIYDPNITSGSHVNARVAADLYVRVIEDPNSDPALVREAGSRLSLVARPKSR